MHSVHSPRRLSSGLMPHVAFAVLVIAARALSSSAVQAGFGGGVQSGSSVSSAGALQSTPSSSSSGDYGGPPMGWSSWTSHAGPVRDARRPSQVPKPPTPTQRLLLRHAADEDACVSTAIEILT